MADEKLEIMVQGMTKKAFMDRVTPKKPDPKKVIFFQCNGEECDNTHFRHAGYMEVMVPVVRPGDDGTIIKDSTQVHVCTKCRKCYVWVNEQMYDVTDQVDLEAWKKSEIELQDATGPGGEC